MQVQNIEISQYNEIKNFINHHSSIKMVDITENTLRKLLKTINVSFTIIGMNRLQSTLMLELGDSYVQQSQRYVELNIDNNKSINNYMPKNLPNHIKTDMRRLIAESIQLYHKMTETIGNVQGRPKKEDFKYGIAYEDARYILPLIIQTNVTVSMSGDKLVDLFQLFHDEFHLFSELSDILSNVLPSDLIRMLNSITYINGSSNDATVVYKYYSDKLNDIDSENPVVCYDYDNSTKKIALGSLTSTSKDSPIDVYNSWDDSEQKSFNLVQRVIGYGHLGVAEQSRNTFGMICSLSCYHQVLRHRIQKIYRAPLRTIIDSEKLEIYIPKSIQKSKFITDYTSLVNKYNDFIKNNIKSFNDMDILLMLLNCHMIKFIVSSNDRNDLWIYRERLCLTAQTEIRELFEKKYEIASEYSDVVKIYGLPPCVNGACKEGKMTCGQISKMREKYLHD